MVKYVTVPINMYLRHNKNVLGMCPLVTLQCISQIWRKTCINYIKMSYCTYNYMYYRKGSHCTEDVRSPDSLFEVITLSEYCEVRSWLTLFYVPAWVTESVFTPKDVSWGEIHLIGKMWWACCQLDKHRQEAVQDIIKDFIIYWAGFGRGVNEAGGCQENKPL